MSEEDAWFVRRGRGPLTSISPTGLMGWLVSIGYLLVVLVLVVMANRSPAYWPVWAVAIVAVTILYVVLAWRMSVPSQS